MHPGTRQGNLNTVIGDNCLFMVGSHVAHDCIVGDNVVLTNNVALGGHVIIEEFEKGYKYHDKVIRHAKVVVSE